jgi:hypothetical protein
MMSDNLTKENFKKNINTQFRVQIEPADAVVIELAELLEGVSTKSQEQFSLLFRGPLDAPFGQGMCNLEHDTMGSFVLFLVPIARSSDGMEYEAVFNRFIDADGKE